MASVSDDLANRERLLSSIELTPIATVVTDPRAGDNPIVAANAAFVRLTGYERAEILGRNCRFLAGKGTSASARGDLRAAIRDGRPALCELVRCANWSTIARTAAHSATR